MLDFLLVDGWVADGTGSPLWRWNVGVQDGRIAWLGKGRPAARQVLPCEDLVIAPGFIDVHTHSDFSLLHTPGAEHKLLQGITTEVLGNCGLSVAPLSEMHRQTAQDYLSRFFGNSRDGDWPWTSVGEYLRCLAESRPAVNALTLIGHSAVRLAVMGFDARPPTASELHRMQALVATGMEDGAAGFSTGLQYTPGSYAETGELVALAEVAGRYGGLYATHMRNQSTGLLDSVREAIRIGNEAGVAVEISHFLASGARNWPSYAEAHQLLHAAVAAGLDITYDMYPYEAGCTMLRVVLPPWVMAGGNAAALARLLDPNVRATIRRDVEDSDSSWDNLSLMAGWDKLLVVQTGDPDDARIVGHTLQEIGALVGKDPLDTAMDLLVRGGMEGSIVAFISAEENVRGAIVGQRAMFGSDSLHVPPATGMVHPRTYGAYPRYFHHFVAQLQALPLQEAVRKATATPAARFGLGDRGLLRAGMAADIVVFDAAALRDTATYLAPRQLSEGMCHVLVNGQLAVEGGRLTEARAGRVLRPASALPA